MSHRRSHDCIEEIIYLSIIPPIDLNLDKFDNLGINIVQLAWKHALRPKNASFALIIHKFGLIKTFRSLAAMSIDAFDVITSAAITTGCHPRDNS